MKNATLFTVIYFVVCIPIYDALNEGVKVGEIYDFLISTKEIPALGKQHPFYKPWYTNVFCGYDLF